MSHHPDNSPAKTMLINIGKGFIILVSFLITAILIQANDAFSDELRANIDSLDNFSGNFFDLGLEEQEKSGGGFSFKAGDVTVINLPGHPYNNFGFVDTAFVKLRLAINEANFRGKHLVLTYDLKHGLHPIHRINHEINLGEKWASDDLGLVELVQKTENNTSQKDWQQQRLVFAHNLALLGKENNPLNNQEAFVEITFIMSGANDDFVYSSEIDNVQITDGDLERNLTINQGSGGGTYITGEEVAIFADLIPGDVNFLHWAGDIQYIKDSTNPITTLIMPNHNINITAIYKTSNITKVNLP